MIPNESWNGSKDIIKWARDPTYKIPININVVYWGLDKSIKEIIQYRCNKCGKQYPVEDIGKDVCGVHIWDSTELYSGKCKYCNTTYYYHCKGAYRTYCYHRHN